MRLSKFFLLGGFCLAAALPLRAQEQGPDAMVKNVTNEVLQIIRSDKDIQAGNSKKVMDLIETKVQQHFDFAHMAQLALGREWKNASAEQKKQIADEFHSLLVRTYSKALTEYKNQNIDFKPFKMNPADTDVKVRSQVVQGGGKPTIPLDYSLEKLPAGWKVYDIEVEGVSLVVNYREDFTAQVRSGGIDGLIKYLQAKNKSGAAGEKK